MNIRMYRNYTEETLPMIAWGAEDLDTGLIGRGYTPTQAVRRLISYVGELNARASLQPDR